jgi:hypothetical protein
MNFSRRLHSCVPGLSTPDRRFTVVNQMNPVVLTHNPCERYSKFLVGLVKNFLRFAAEWFSKG